MFHHNIHYTYMYYFGTLKSLNISKTNGVYKLSFECEKIRFYQGRHNDASITNLNKLHIKYYNNQVTITVLSAYQTLFHGKGTKT